MAVAQRIELFDDYKVGCGFESHQSHASSEALGFSHLEPLLLLILSQERGGYLSAIWDFSLCLSCEYAGSLGR